MTISINYVTKIATLSATGDTNVFTLNAEDLIEARSAWWVAANKTKNVADMQRFKSVELEALRQLRMETDNKISSGKITPSKF